MEEQRGSQTTPEEPKSGARRLPFWLGVGLFWVGSSLCGGNLLLAGIAGMLSRDLYRIEDYKASRLVPAAVVQRDLGPGTVIGPGDVSTVEMDELFVPTEACRDAASLVGRTVVEPMLSGELARLERLAPEGSGQGINALIPEGMRGISLQLSSEDRVSGALEPGDYVDLIVTLVERFQESSTVTLLQGARMLAVEEKISKTANGERVRTPLVTLLVTDEQAELVAHAIQVGRPKLVLRAELDFDFRIPRGSPPPWIGNQLTRLAASDFASRYSEADVQRWVEIIYGNHIVREPIVDPSLLRDIPIIETQPQQPPPKDPAGGWKRPTRFFGRPAGQVAG